MVYKLVGMDSPQLKNQRSPRIVKGRSFPSPSSRAAKINSNPMKQPKAISQEDLKNSRTKQELAEQERSHETIPENEWNFFGPRIPCPPSWQMNHWLNYEYARSYRPVVEAVLKLRKAKPRSREEGTWPPSLKVPRFAAYLAREYPEFPAQPWLEISREEREKHVLRSGDKASEDPFEDGQ